VTLDPELLKILVCPQCKGELGLNEKEDGLLCHSCRLVYPVKNDIPVMLIDEAVPLRE
jgi:uncharacterized protein